MFKNAFIILLLGSSCIAVYPPPPVLERIESNICWHNSVLQFMRNIKPITKKGDAVADDYFDISR